MSPSKKKTAKAETAKPVKAEKAASHNAQGIPLGRPAFGAGTMPNDVDQSVPAGAMQIAESNTKEAKPGSSTVTLMNPTPPPATAKPPKRG